MATCSPLIAARPSHSPFSPPRLLSWHASMSMIALLLLLSVLPTAAGAAAAGAAAAAAAADGGGGGGGPKISKLTPKFGSSKRDLPNALGIPGNGPRWEREMDCTSLIADLTESVNGGNIDDIEFEADGGGGGGPAGAAVFRARGIEREGGSTIGKFHGEDGNGDWCSVWHNPKTGNLFGTFSIGTSLFSLQGTSSGSCKITYMEVSDQVPDDDSMLMRRLGHDTAAGALLRGNAVENADADADAFFAHRLSAASSSSVSGSELVVAPERSLQSEPSVVDVLVAYTEGALCDFKARGSGCAFAESDKDDFCDAVQYNMDQANTVLVNSGLGHFTFRAVSCQILHSTCTLDVTYSSYNPSWFIENLFRKNPGYGVPGARNDHGADLVVGIISGTGPSRASYGSAKLGFNGENVSNDLAYSVLVQDALARSTLSMAHEMFHNMGCDHDPETSLGPHSHTAVKNQIGYRDTTDKYRTVVHQAVGWSARVPALSGPTTSWNGYILGDDKHDNAAVVATNMPNAGAFRSEVYESCPCTTPGLSCSDQFCVDTCGSDAQCDDGNVCTVDVCDSVSSTCSNTRVPDCCNADSDCSSDVCVGTEACVDNACVAGQPLACASPLICDSASASCVCPPSDPTCCVVDADCSTDICSGVETCDTNTNTCVSGTAPTCNSPLVCISSAGGCICPTFSASCCGVATVGSVSDAVTCNAATEDCTAMGECCVKTDSECVEGGTPCCDATKTCRAKGKRGSLLCQR